MPVAFRSMSVGIDTSGTGRDVTVTCPTGVQPEDFLLLVGANDAPNFYESVTGGFTVIDPDPLPDDTAFDIASNTWYRFATSSDIGGSTTYTATKAGSSNAQPRLLICLAYTGVDPGAFPLASSKHSYLKGSESAAINANVQCPTPTNPDDIDATDLVVRAYCFGEDVSQTGITFSATPSGWTARGATSTVSNVSSRFNTRMLICDRIGSTDTATISANKKGSWDIHTIAVPAAPDITDTGAGFFPYTAPS